MTAQIIAVQLFDLVVFGGTGDLAQRKLMPALFQRDCDEQMPSDSRIIGISRQDYSRESYIAFIEQAIREHVDEALIDEHHLSRFLGRLHHVTLDATGDGGWNDLQGLLEGKEDRVRVFYLATAPRLFGDICRRIGDSGLNTPETRVVLEKPIGQDLASAKSINDAVGQVFNEHQIYRIDHYLGKETVQNLMAVRFANSMFEPVSKAEVAIMIDQARCAIWCRTIFCSSYASLRWRRPPALRPMPCAMKS
jgi:glucose-6-phosphate 1-dehydrogenase